MEANLKNHGALDAPKMSDASKADMTTYIRRFGTVKLLRAYFETVKDAIQNQFNVRLCGGKVREKTVKHKVLSSLPLILTAPSKVTKFAALQVLSRSTRL